MGAQATALAKSAEPLDRPRGQIAFAATVFLSAFLLFQIQLIVGKQLLPWFGGTAAVWNTCLVFFQLLLLIGYGYSHFVAARLKNSGTLAHVALLLSSAIALACLAVIWHSPVYPGNAWRPQTPEHPFWELMRLLIVSIGFPFFLLSTTAPLIQTWYARANPRHSPYPLYALSNLGSLLGLLTYPVLFEPNLTLRNQGRLWMLIYFAFVCSSAISAFFFWRAEATIDQPVKEDLTSGPEARTSITQRLLWLGLSACGTVMLLSVTNLICQEVAVVPFLWVLPLSIYLLSFVLCFKHGDFYRRGFFHLLFAAAAVWGGILFLSGENVGIRTQIFGFSLLLFASCMVYHGELARLKPQAQNLTSFYLHIAAGGALGSIFVGLIAPLVFPAIWEFQLGLWFSGILVAAVLLRDKTSWFYQHLRWLPLALLAVMAAIADEIGVAVTIFHIPQFYFHLLVGALTLCSLAAIATGPARPARNFLWLRAAALCGWCLFGLLFLVQADRQKSHAIVLTRNFYGVLRIAYSEPISEKYALVEKHGLTLHGVQLQAPDSRRTPTIYYGPSSGIGLLLNNHPNHTAAGSEKRPLRLGVIGLGVGTLAAYAQPGDYVRFYELNPEVVQFANGRQALFSFLNDSLAKVEVVMGDARISLERELTSGRAQNFDVLVIDAFASDSIPLHLLTGEAMDIYLRHLRSPQSVLVFHISNRTLDLLPVLAGLAQQHQLQLERILVNNPRGEAELPSSWVLMAADPTVLNLAALTEHSSPVKLLGPPRFWSDDYSNLLQLLR